ncbi:hypothetical protein [Candidatus Palauibacter sp.]|uniref:hypothetical protein n=1 Tax=Candidatus Palauibacter sp. TaxID=3101350 RepID=UPI003B02DB9A
MGILRRMFITGRAVRYFTLVLVGFLGARMYVRAHAREVPSTAPEPGMVLVKETWQAPSPAVALRALMVPHEPGHSGNAPAIAVLRQQFEPRSKAELDAFAAELLGVMREGNGDQRRDAAIVLLVAANSESKDGVWPADPGTPYAGAAEVFRRLYESYEDPLSGEAKTALADLLDSGGIDYVRALFEASEPPPPCQPQGGGVRSGERHEMDNPCPNPPNMWCQAGKLLLYGAELAHERSLAGAPDRVRYRQLCESGVFRGSEPTSEFHS